VLSRRRPLLHQQREWTLADFRYVVSQNRNSPVTTS